MDRDDLWKAIDHERSSLADLFDDLSEQEWATASLCADWRVRDVAAHLMLAQAPLGQAVLDLIKARGSVNRMIHDTAVRQADRPTGEFSAALRAMGGSRKTAPGISDVEPLIDALVHGQDITRPLGRRWTMPVEAAAVAATRVWTMPRPLNPWRRPANIEFVATDCSWSIGQGRRIEAPIAEILLMLTGRLPDIN